MRARKIERMVEHHLRKTRAAKLMRQIDFEQFEARGMISGCYGE